MALRIPNEADAAFAPQARLFSDDIEALVRGYEGTGVISGCAVTAQGSPDMTVAVAAGTAAVAEKLVTVTAGNVTITAADATNPRIDLITADASGTKAAVAGTAAANPVAPALPASRAVLAAVYVSAGDTAIDANQIIDKRVRSAQPIRRVHTNTRSTDLFQVSPMGWPFLAGSFVPQADSVEVDLSIGTAIFGFPGSSIGWDFFWGDNAVVPAGTLIPKTQDSALGTGVSWIALPATNSHHGVTAATFRLTGLTPGNTYRYEIGSSIIGGGSATAIHPQNPYQIACSHGVTGPPDWGTIVAVRMATTDLAIIKSERLFRFADSLLGTVVLAGGNGGRVAINTEGSRVVTTSTNSASPQPMWIVDTGVPSAAQYGDEWGIPTIRSTLTLAANEIANAVKFVPNSNTAWVAFQGDAGRYSTIQPLNTTTGAFTTPTMAAGTLGATFANPIDIEIDATGTYAYVSLNNTATNNIRKVTLATGAIAGSATVATPSGPLALSPDGATLYVATTTAPATLTTITTSSMAIADTTALPSTMVPTAMECFNDGINVMISSSETGAGGAQIYQYTPAYDNFYTQWPLAAGSKAAYDIALGPWGDIWVPNYTDQVVACWPGCQLRYTRNPTSTSDIGENSWVRITGAT